MSLPDRVRVKLSSEAAEGISITPVVVQEIGTRELVEYMLGLTGKDEARVRELLLRGTLVSGASRFRWRKGATQSTRRSWTGALCTLRAGSMGSCWPPYAETLRR